MRKKVALLLAAVMMLAAVPFYMFGGLVIAGSDVTVNESTGEIVGLEPHFLAALLDSGMTEVTTKAALTVTELDLRGSDIMSLAGIEYFMNLTKLNCGNNRLTELDVSANTQLTELYCGNNRLTELDVRSNTQLTWLSCGGNQLAALDVSANTKLEYLDCLANQLKTLDVSKNTKLANLSCDSNQLAALDVSKNVALTGLACSDNQLTKLDVRANTALLWLEANSNRLTTLDVPANTERISCNDNQLTELDVRSNTKLTELWCANNQLKALDVRSNTALIWIECGGNRLTALDLSANTALELLGCYDNQLTELDLSANTALIGLACSNNRLTTLDLTANTELTWLEAYANRLTTLDVSASTELTSLRCYNNYMASPAAVIGWEKYFKEAGKNDDDSASFKFFPQNPTDLPPTPKPTPTPTPGGSSGGGSNPITTVITSPTDKNVSSVGVDTGAKSSGEPVAVIVNLEAREDTRGNVTFQIKRATVLDAYRQALAAIKKLPIRERKNGATVTVAAGHSATATTAKARLDNYAVKLLSSSNMGLTVESSLFGLQLAPTALKEIIASHTSNLALEVKPARLSGEARRLIGNNPAYSFSLKAGSKKVTLSNGSARLSIPFTGDLYTFALVEVSGNPQEVRYLDESDYSLENGWLTWTGNPNGVYALVPRE